MTRIRTLIALGIAVAATATLLTAAARAQVFPFGGPTDPYQGPPVLWLDPSLQFPAVGNIEGVREWRFGRLLGAEIASGNPDALIRVRTAHGEEIRITAPRAPLVELARVSQWMQQNKQRPGAADYVERMIAYDVDETGRLIAMMSLEPVFRSRRRLARALR